MNSLQINTGRHTELLAFFDNLKEKLVSNIQMLALRPKLVSDVTSSFTGDFDFIIRKKDVYPALSLIYDFCKNSGVNFTLHQTYKNKRVFKFFTSASENRCITIELWTAVEFTQTGVTKSFASDAIFDAIDAKHVSATELLALIYITHLHHKKKNIFSEENIYRFAVFTKSLHNTENLLNNGETATLLQMIGDRELPLETANENALQLLRKIGLKTSNSLVKDSAYFLFRLNRKLFNLTKVVPVVGPDGVGKGSVSDQALAKLANWVSFRYKALYRIRKVYKARKLLIRNYNNKPDNMLDEQINHYILFTSFLTIRLLPLVKKEKRILLDRYFLDYLATPIRYLKEGANPRRIPFYGTMLRLTPTPNSMVFMACKTSSLAERKNELSDVSIDFLQHLYCEFILKKRIPVVLFLSTENEMEQSSGALIDFLNSSN